MELSEERRALRDAVRGLLAEYSTRAALDAPAGYDAGLWSRLCKQIGVAGLAVPEAYGGAGASLLESHVVLTEWGRALAPGPMLGCGVLATQALLRAGDPDACERLLPGVCAGDLIVAPAWPADPDQVAVTATADGRLTGEARPVLDAGTADVLLVAAHDPAGTDGWDGIGLYEVTAAGPAVSRRPVDGLDLTRRLGSARFDAATGRRIGGGDLLAGLRDLACVALSAEQVGAAERAFESTVEYVRHRFQFGRAIGSFQVLQHRLAEAYVRLEAATTASWTAAEALVAGRSEAPELAGMAKVCCSEALQAIAGEMVQMHGGIAITWEHDAHLYLRRAYADAQLFGSPAYHVERLAAALLPD